MDLCYGAKGIYYYVYTHNINCADNDQLGILNVDGTKRLIYGESKYDEIKSINTRLSTLGPTLMQLNWQDAFSRRKINSPTISKFSMLNGTSITNISTTEWYDTTHVEAGHFKDQSNVDYLYIVNRRTRSTDTRNITITFNNSINLEITEMYIQEIYG